jgi:hypothetical protein
MGHPFFDAIKFHYMTFHNHFLYLLNEMCWTTSPKRMPWTRTYLYSESRGRRSSRTAWPLKMGRICCPETSVTNYQSTAVPWLRRLVAGLQSRRSGFDPGSVCVGFVVDKGALGQVFPPNTSVFPCQFHSTGAPLLGKWKNWSPFSSSSSQGCTISLKTAVLPYHLLRGPSPHKNYQSTLCNIPEEQRSQIIFLL